MQWQFNGKDTTKEVWCWEAHYLDGTVLKQYDDQGQFHQFKEIDQDRLIAFKMVSDHFDNSYTLKFSKGMKLIHYYDNYILQAGSPYQSRIRVYCFGYEDGKEKLVNMIFPNNELVTTTKPEEVKIG